ncbi:tetratricopeptide repeat protein, partial [Aerosakkonemataceae cyanobacterium BLCC-F50]
MKNLFNFFRGIGLHRRQTIKIIVTFLATFFITCGFIQIPAFPQFVQSQANPQVLIEQSRKFYGVGNFTEAVTVLQQAVEAFRAKGDRLGEAIALSNLSLTFKQLGQLEKAYSYITESLKLLTNSEL